MGAIRIVGLMACIVMQSWAIWVPTPTKDTLIFRQEGIWLPPGSNSSAGSDSSYTWVDIPDIGITILPPIASSENKAAVARSGTAQPAPQSSQVTIEEKSKEEAAAAQREATIPRFNDVSCDVEYGVISYENKMKNKYSGGSISVKGRYERSIDDYTSWGVRGNNEYTYYLPYTVPYSSTKFKIPGSDFLLLGGFYRKTVLSNVDAGGQLNSSFFFRQSYKYSSGSGSATVDTSMIVEWAVNPQVYGIYNYALGPVRGYAGAFAGYQYASFSYTKHQIPYAVLLSGGTTFGRYVAAQADVAVSHQFCIVGGQVPIYFSRYFSLTPGCKYPILFQETGLMDLLITVGIASRF